MNNRQNYSKVHPKPHVLKGHVITGRRFSEVKDACSKYVFASVLFLSSLRSSSALPRFIYLFIHPTVCIWNETRFLKEVNTICIQTEYIASIFFSLKL